MAPAQSSQNPGQSNLQLEEEAREFIAQLTNSSNPTIQNIYGRMISPVETDRRELARLFRQLVFQLTNSQCTYSFDQICLILDTIRKETFQLFAMEEGTFVEYDAHRSNICMNAFKTFFDMKIHSHELIAATLKFFTNNIGATEFVNKTGFTFEWHGVSQGGGEAIHLLHEYFPHLREAVYRGHASLTNFSKLFEKFKLDPKPIEVTTGTYEESKAKEWCAFIKTLLCHSSNLNTTRSLVTNLMRKTITNADFIQETAKQEQAGNSTALANLFPHFKFAAKAKYLKDPYEHLLVYDKGKAETLLQTLVTSVEIKRGQKSFELLMETIRPKTGLGFEGYAKSKANDFCERYVSSGTIMQGFHETIEHLQAMASDDSKFSQIRATLKGFFNPDSGFQRKLPNRLWRPKETIFRLLP